MPEHDRLEALVSEQLRLPCGIEALRQRYQDASPFQHLVLDDLFPTETVEALGAEMTRMEAAAWILFDDANLHKFNSRSPTDFGPSTQRFVSFLHSATFLHFMSEITGLSALMPDPYMHGGGFHAVPRGGKFDIHVDSNVHSWTGLRRRIAIIVFLNKEWRADYKGELELWQDCETGCVTRIAPRFNRTVIFYSGENTYHGYPEPLECPAGTFRQSFLTYLYTNDAHAVPNRSTLYAPRFQRQAHDRRWIKELAPPAVVRLASRVRAKLRAPSKS